MANSPNIWLQHVTEPAVTYRVGDHTVALTCTARWQWKVAIDGRELPNQYPSQAEAWTAGVQEAFH
jgi:hypothetical protein